ncbi:MAG: DUF839 domain-containing protein [Acidobacteriota bacterium]|nr:DUF839 domain-containing protein [Acidobacteriota bacterium]
MARFSRRVFAVSVAAALGAVTLQAGHGVRPGTTPGTYQGPSSSETPYVVPTQDGWGAVSLLTVGDGAEENGYRMVGIPDGLGAMPGRFTRGRYRYDKDYMTVFMNHELGSTAGVVRDHGAKGAFVSQWTVDLDSLEVEQGQDLIQDVYTWDATNHRYVYANNTPEATFNRFCSADLPASRAFYNPRTRKGFAGRIYTNGEESGNEGRAFAHVVTGGKKGSTYQLPYLGRFSWENSVAHPSAGDTTIVAGLDDSTPGQVHIYVGEKRRRGNPVERAGLQGGKLFGVKVTDGGANYGNLPAPLENNGAVNGVFTLMDVSDVATGSGAALQATSVERGITEWARPEDGAWDRNDPKVFYFVTTGAIGQTSRLYKLRLNSLVNPTGGTVEMVVDSASLTGKDGEVARTFDNITVDGAGRVLIQEDPGGAAYLAKTWRVDPSDPLAAQDIAASDPARFAAGAPLGTNEESSGIIEITTLVKHAWWYDKGRRYYLADMQAHYDIGDPELVEGGQLYMLVSPKGRYHHDDDDNDEDGWDDDRGDRDDDQH